MTTSKNEKILIHLENKFKKISNLDIDLSIYPLKASQFTQVLTNKNKSKEFSEVFTPLWLVDAMIHQVKFKFANYNALDLCAGYGQFSIRLMRHYFNKFPDFNIGKFIKGHSFSELQLSSCYKLISIFDINLNLFIGDSTKLRSLPSTAKGIWCYIESFDGWVCLTKTVQSFFEKKKVISEADFVKKLENIINYLNETYTNKLSMLEKYKKTAKIRLEFLRLVKAGLSESFEKDNNVQKVSTPMSIIHDMINCINDIEHKSILVLYNAEIVEHLIYDKGISADKITFAVTNESSVLADAVKAMYGVEIKSLPSKEFYFIRSHLGHKSFDVCLSNPPWSDGLDLKLLQALMASGNKEASIAKEYVFVHPANWLIDLKEKSPLFTNIKNILNGKLKSVKAFNGNAVFNIDLFYPCVISHIDINHCGDIKVNYMGESFASEYISDITKFGKHWRTIVKPFVKKIEDMDSVWEHNKVKSVTPNMFYCQFAVIIGHVSNDRSFILKDDFYRVTQKDSNNDKGIRKPMNNRPGPTFEFTSENERDNFIDYLKADFARFCLAIYKISGNIFYGEMDLIPWLDFTQSWDDEKLFKHFDVNQETQDYIRKFLPDFYNLRNIQQLNIAI